MGQHLSSIAPVVTTNGGRLNSDKLCESAAVAVADVHNGASILIGGFGGAGIPSALLEALLVKSKAQDLTLINNNAGAGNPSFLELVRSGRVRRIVCSYPRMPGSEVLAEQIAAGRLSLEVIPQGTFVERIRAAGAGLGPFFCPTGFGTSLANGKEQRVIDGKGYVLENPLSADFAFVKANQSDRFGNLVYRYSERNFGPVMSMAARTTIVETASVVELGAIDPCHVVTPGVFVQRIVEVAR